MIWIIVFRSFKEKKLKKKMKNKFPKKDNRRLQSLILLLLVIVPISTFSQINKVEKIIEKINENDFERVFELRDKLKDETPKVLVRYIDYLTFNDLDFYGRNIDLAYKYLKETLIERESLKITEKYDYCLNYKLCEDSLVSDRKKLEQEAYDKYSKDSNIVNLKYFVENFENTKLIQKANELIEIIDFEQVKNINTIAAFKEFLIRYPNSAFEDEAKNRWEELLFKECLQKDDEESYRAFLEQFPYGKYLKQARINLGKIRYSKTIESEDLEVYRAYLNEFGYEGSYIELNDEVQNIKNKYCFVTFNKIKNSTSLDTLTSFLWDFEDCQYVDSIKLRIEVVEFNNLNTNFSIKKANEFLINYPESDYKNQILLRLFDLEYALIGEDINNNQIQQFQRKYQDIDIGEKLSLIGNPIIYSNSTNWNRKFGFINPLDSNIIIYPMYQEVRDFSNGLAAVKFNNLWGFIDKRGNVIIDIIYDEVRDFQEGFAGVKTSGLWQIIDKNNIFISNQKYQNVGVCNSGLINVNTLTLGWAYISTSGQIKSKGKSYLSASSFSSGYAFVQEDSKFLIIDTSFSKIFEVDYNSPLYNNYSIYEACSGFEAGLTRTILCNFYERRIPYSLIAYGDALLLNEGLVYDRKTNECWISENIYFDDEILVIGKRRTERGQQPRLLIYTKNGFFQSINITASSYGNTPDLKISRENNNVVYDYRDGEHVFSERIVSMPDVKKEKYKVFSDNGKYHFEDKNKSILGNKIDYTSATNFLNGRAIVGVSNNYLLIDTNSQQLGDVYSKLERVNSDLYVAQLNGEYFLIDLNGNALSKGYDFMDNKIYDGTIIVASNNLKGYINVKGNEIIAPQFIEAAGFSNGKAIVTALYGNSNCYGWDCKGTRVIDKKGNRVYGDFEKILEYNPKMKF
jgi:outer membrane protein assembly factor BamD (BamD/ComL family)